MNVGIIFIVAVLIFSLDTNFSPPRAKAAGPDLKSWGVVPTWELGGLVSDSGLETRQNLAGWLQCWQSKKR